MSHCQEMAFYQVNSQSQVCIFILMSHQLFSSKQVPLTAPAQTSTTLMSCNIPWSNFLHICYNLLPILLSLFQRAIFPTSNKPHFPSINETKSPVKQRKPILTLPLGSVCFLLQHLPLTTSAHALCLTQIFSCLSFCFFAAAKDKTMFPSSTLLQLPVGSSWLAKLSALSPGHAHPTLPPHTLGTRQQISLTPEIMLPGTDINH